MKNKKIKIKIKIKNKNKKYTTCPYANTFLALF